MEEAHNIALKSVILEKIVIDLIINIGVWNQIICEAKKRPYNILLKTNQCQHGYKFGMLVIIPQFLLAKNKLEIIIHTQTETRKSVNLVEPEEV